jgi:hypothetical protein
VRRTVATLLVVASPVLMVVPADAGERRPAAPATAEAPAAPAAGPTFALPAVARLLAPGAATAAVPVPEAATPAVPARAKNAAAAVLPAVRRARAGAQGVGDADAVYAARLQAELCQARMVFCGLDRGGRYPAG